MKSIILSIQPKYVAKILSGEKTIEVRKVIPQCETPFKVYVYCTKAKLKNGKYLYLNPLEKRKDLGITEDWIPLESFLTINGGTINEFDCSLLNGKVVAEFIVNKVTNITHKGFVNPEFLEQELFQKSCLSTEEFFKYSDNYKKDLYGFHISDLKIYDKPKELGEFKTVKVVGRYHRKNETKFEKLQHSKRVEVKYITRPPQSWQYCVEREDLI